MCDLARGIGKNESDGCRFHNGAHYRFTVGECQFCLFASCYILGDRDEERRYRLRIADE